MWLAHALAHLRNQGQNNQRSNRVTDKGRNNNHQTGKHHQHAIQTHAIDLLGYGAGNRVQETGAGNRFAEGEASGGEDDDGPEEVVKVFFGEDAGAEEEDDGNDGDDAHIAEDAFELVRYAP